MFYPAPACILNTYKYFHPADSYNMKSYTFLLLIFLSLTPLASPDSTASLDAQTQPTDLLQQSFVLKTPPCIGSSCRSNCSKNTLANYKLPIGTKGSKCECSDNEICQDGYCLPRKCFPCPKGAQCFAGPDCPSGFDCTKGTCQRHCTKPYCAPGKMCALVMVCDPVGSDVKTCRN